ncbi:MAG: Hydrogenase 2 maturation protease [Candidatus Dichloromethanomonas elyunquensis]|nr:MAG: Hydrogenase 2 maturation protease [Candidatus Dichloromethanomonas elyunquensis]
MTAKSPKIMIMGVGNVLLSDEGLGVYFLQNLKQENLPDNVELLEGGTAGLELVHLIREVDYLIIIDAVNAGVQPGSIFRFRPDAIKVLPENYEVSFHQVGIMEVLTLANILGNAPKTIIYGIQPKNLEWGLELSEEVRVVWPCLREKMIEDINNINTQGDFQNYVQAPSCQGG